MDNTSDTLLNKYEKVTKEVSDDLFSTHGPYWKARDNVAQILITISSGILAISAIFLPDVLSSCILAFFIFITWLLLILVVASCIGSLWFNMQITSIYIQFINQEPLIKNTLKSTSPSEEKKILSDSINDTFKYISKKDKKALCLLNVGMVCFIVSLIMLCIVGVIRCFVCCY